MRLCTHNQLCLVLLLGLVYLQQISPLLIVSGVCIFSTTSSIFMFNTIYPFYTKALEVHHCNIKLLPLMTMHDSGYLGMAVQLLCTSPFRTLPHLDPEGIQPKTDGTTKIYALFTYIICIILISKKL